MPYLKVKNEELRMLAEKYNTVGKQAVCEILQSEYEIKSPSTVIKRMKRVEAFHYDSTLDQFQFHQNISPDEVFLSMNELCAPIERTRLKSDVSTMEHKPQAMEKLIQELIGDRLLEISKYIIMDPLSKKIIIEKSSLVTDGYQVVMH